MHHPLVCVFERENIHVTMGREIIEKKKSFVLLHAQNTWKDNHVSEQQVKNIKKIPSVSFFSVFSLVTSRAHRENCKTSLY